MDCSDSESFVCSRSHSLQQNSTGTNPEAISNPQTQDAETKTRKSARINNKPQQNYKDLHTRANLIWSEGNTEVSKHLAEFEHGPEDVSIKALKYDDNWHRRGYKEALEIRRKHPNLNLDQGRTYIPHIYGRILDVTSADLTSTTDKSEGNLPDTSPQISSEDGGPKLMATESSSTN